MAKPYLIQHAERVEEEYHVQGRNPEYADDEFVEGQFDFGFGIVSEAELFARNEPGRVEHKANKTMRLTDSRFIELN